MVRVAKVYYMIHYGDEEARLYAIHMILDSAKALFDRLRTDNHMNKHITLTSVSVSEHGIVIDRKMLYSFHREMGIVIDHSVMAMMKVDDSVIEQLLELPEDGKPTLSESTILSLSIDEDLRALQ